MPDPRHWAAVITPPCRTARSCIRAFAASSDGASGSGRRPMFVTVEHVVRSRERPSTDGRPSSTARVHLPHGPRGDRPIARMISLIVRAVSGSSKAVLRPVDQSPHGRADRLGATGLRNCDFEPGRSACPWNRPAALGTIVLREPRHTVVPPAVKRRPRGSRKSGAFRLDVPAAAGQP
jgi:hypothetical protein